MTPDLTPSFVGKEGSYYQCYHDQYTTHQSCRLGKTCEGIL